MPSGTFFLISPDVFSAYRTWHIRKREHLKKDRTEFIDLIAGG